MDKDKLKRIKNILLFYFGKNKITMGGKQYSRTRLFL